jgi:hypothetical protein
MPERAIPENLLPVAYVNTIDARRQPTAPAPPAFALSWSPGLGGQRKVSDLGSRCRGVS